VGGGLEGEVRVRRYLTLTGGYLFVDLPQRAQSHVQLPLVAATIMFRVGRLSMADRNRFEQLVGFGTSPVRYRNRLLVDVSFASDNKWHLFGDDEVFFDFSSSILSQNRLRLGGGIRVAAGVALDTYYLQRNLRRGAPTTHVIGTTLRIALHPEPKGEKR